MDDARAMEKTAQESERERKPQSSESAFGISDQVLGWLICSTGAGLLVVAGIISLASTSELSLNILSPITLTGVVFFGFGIVIVLLAELNRKLAKLKDE